MKQPRAKINEKFKIDVLGKMIFLNRYFFVLNIWLFDAFLFESIKCVTHWKVTESGRIESKEDSMFTLLRPYDLAAFIKQADRLQRLNLLRDILQSKEFTTKRDTAKSFYHFYNYCNH